MCPWGQHNYSVFLMPYADTAGNVEALQTQINELVLLTDADNDGYSENQGDCDDTNATVYPGATEDETDGENKTAMDVDEDETADAGQNSATTATANASLTSGSDTENEEDSNRSAEIAKDLAIEEQNKIQLLNLLNLFKEFRLGAAYAPHLVDAFYPYDEVSAVHDFKYLANGLASQDLNGWSPDEVDIVVAIFADIVRKEAGAKDLHD